MVGSLGFVWRHVQQLGLHVHNERPVWYGWRPDGSEHRCASGHHLPSRKKAKSGNGSLWSNGACRRSWGFSCLRSNYPVVRVEMAVLNAVRYESSRMIVPLLKSYRLEVCSVSWSMVPRLSQSRRMNPWIPMVQLTGPALIWELVL